MTWNTGCNNIGNTLGQGINLLDMEDGSLAISIPNNGYANWKSVIFPWCNNVWEVRHKSFRVANIQTGDAFLYLFQEYQTNKICWSFVTSDDPWASRQVIKNGIESDNEQEPFGAIDIIITGDRVCGLPSSSVNNLFWETLAKAQQISSLAGSIGGNVGMIAAAAA